MYRVRWTPEERKTLINQAATLLLDRHAFSIKEAFNLAQGALPESRRRQITTLTQVGWFVERVPKRVREIEGEKHKTAEQRISQAVAEASARAYFTFEDEWIRKAGNIFSKVLMVALEDPGLRSLLVKHYEEPIRFNGSKVHVSQGHASET